MLNLLFKKREQEVARDVELNRVLEELKKEYPYENIPELRKKYLTMHIQKYGYLTYSYQKALDELTNEDVLTILESNNFIQVKEIMSCPNCDGKIIEKKILTFLYMKNFYLLNIRR